MKKTSYIKPETLITPTFYEYHLLSQSPGSKEKDDEPWDGPWDGKENEFEDDDEDDGFVWKRTNVWE